MAFINTDYYLLLQDTIEVIYWTENCLVESIPVRYDQILLATKNTLEKSLCEPAGQGRGATMIIAIREAYTTIQSISISSLKLKINIKQNQLNIYISTTINSQMVKSR